MTNIAGHLFLTSSSYFQSAAVRADGILIPNKHKALYVSGYKLATLYNSISRPKTDEITLSRIIIIFFLLTNVQIAFGQMLDSYLFSLSGAHFPGGGNTSEIYSKKKNKHKHITTESALFNKKKQKILKLPYDIKIESTINQLDSLFRLTEFKFTINKTIIDSIKAHNKFNSPFKISATDIDNFFSNEDTITLKLKDIKPKMLEGNVIDGFPYSFDLTIVPPNKDSVVYKFNGNFYDRVKTSNIKNWLPVYLAYRQNNFFDIMPMNEYFTEENLESVLLRFIEWTK